MSFGFCGGFWCIGDDKARLFWVMGNLMNFSFSLLSWQKLCDLGSGELKLKVCLKDLICLHCFGKNRI